jgi:hypothetical protein
VAVPLLVHPLPSGGFEEQASVLSTTPLWGLIHASIAIGCVLTALGALLVLAGGGPRRSALERMAWGAVAVGMVFFAGVALVNAWVMHPLAARSAVDPTSAALFAAFNDLLVGYGWLGNPLWLAGLTVLAWLEVRDARLGLPWWATLGGLVVVGLSWLRGVGSATGLTLLEPFILANVPAFAWLALVGWRITRSARPSGEPRPAR